MTKARSLSDFIESDGSVTLVDNQKIKVGTGNDLEIYHDASDSYIKDAGTGILKLQGSEIRIQSTSGENMAIFNPNGSVQLQYDNSTKLSTISSGVNIAGQLYNASDFTIYSGGDISLDADGGDILFKDGGSLIGFVSMASSNLNLTNNASDGDIIFTGNDGGSSVTALTLDMSDAGSATFNSNVTASGQVEGTSLRASVGTDSGSQLSLFADASGHCFIAGHTISLNVGANSGRTMKVNVNSSGNVTLYETISVQSSETSSGQVHNFFSRFGANNNLSLGYVANGSTHVASFVGSQNNLPLRLYSGSTQFVDIAVGTNGGSVQIAKDGSGSHDGALSVVGTSSTGDMITRFEYSGNDNDVKGIRVNAPNTSGTITYMDLCVDPELGAAGIAVGQSSGGLAIGNSDLGNAEFFIENAKTINGVANNSMISLDSDVVEATKSGGRVSACVQDIFHIGGEKYKNPRYFENASGQTRTYYDGAASGYAGYGYPQNTTYIPPVFIPYSPTQVYSLSCTIYQHTGNANHYMGVIGYDENFNAVYVDGIGTYQYILASNSAVSAGSFIKTQNAISGWQGSGATDGNKMDEGTVYIRPMLLLNYASSITNVAVVCGFTLMPCGVSNTLLHSTDAGTNF